MKIFHFIKYECEKTIWEFVVFLEFSHFVDVKEMYYEEFLFETVIWNTENLGTLLSMAFLIF